MTTFKLCDYDFPITKKEYEVKSMNLTLMTDFYELTMMQGYFMEQRTERVVFDLFYRSNPCGNGYAVCAGLEQAIDYIKQLHFSS